MIYGDANDRAALAATAQVAAYLTPTTARESRA
jgi:hypothetical protein